MIEIDNLTVAYAGSPAIQKLSGGFRTGSMTAVVGPNGAGKSTLLKAIMGWVPASQGQIRLNGVSPGQLAYLPQHSELDRTFPISVRDVVLMGCWRRARPFAAFTRRNLDEAGEALATVGLGAFETRYIGSLSAGQLQRVLFARAIMQDARLLLLDEPFTALDERTTHDLLDLVRHWNREQRTVVAVLHDLQQVRSWFPHTLLLACAPIAWGATSEVLTPRNLDCAKCLVDADDGSRSPSARWPR
jgi:zinc/manganese transport system ATP-binding protein